MSASPGDPQPVFDLIVTRARDLCDAYGVTVFEFDGTLIHWRAATGVSDDPTVRGAAQAMFPMAPTREWGVGRAILERRVIRIDDLETEPGLSPALRAGTAKSSVAIPLMRGDVAIGALALASRERGGFSDSQIELLQDLRRTGGDRDHQRRDVSRVANPHERPSGIAGIPDRDQRRAEGHQPLDLRSATGAGYGVETAARLCNADQARSSAVRAMLFALAAHLGFPPEYEAAAIGRPGVASRQHAPVDRRAVSRDAASCMFTTWPPIRTIPRTLIRLGKQRTSLGRAAVARR